MNCSKILSLVLLGLCLICSVNAFGQGAPHSTCSDNVPHHNDLEPNLTPSPYSVKVDKLSYSPGDIITINISSEVGWPLKGFQIRANRISGNVEEIVGSFVDIPPDANEQAWYSTRNETNCLTHKNNKDKKSVVLKWRAPSKSVGDIVLSAGVVRDFLTFWVNIKSAVIKANVAVTVEPVEPVDTFYPDLSFSECGRSKGCIFWPSICNGDNCRFVVTYKTVENGKYVDIEMKGETKGYLALGLSYDKKMGHDEVHICGSTQDNHGFQHGYSPSYFYTKHYLNGITNMQIKREGNVLYCRFRRPMVMTIKWPDYYYPPKNVKVSQFDLNDDFYVQIATGGYYMGTVSTHKHIELPVVTTSKVDFQTNKIMYAELMHAYLRSHAILALTAWLLFAGLLKAITANREGAAARKLCGIQAWFQVHRLVAFLAAACTAVAIIVIFVYLKKFTIYAFAHGVIGLIVMGMVIIQILAGLLRPGLDSSRRPAWQILHYVWGNLTHVLAAVVMLLGVQSVLYDKYFQWAMTIIISVWMGVQVIFDIIFAKVRTNELLSKAAPKPESNHHSKYMEEEQEETKGSGFTWLLVIYIIVLLVLYVAALVFLASW